ncbi:serine-rich adhesin for platelets isoform X2 [Hoplias malabaricus]|uniref:serine-rich adhesin for platelets isoform X2 n=1 Tax=Hoplias malabaricus TaxID=27720 RepID=UPI0034638482
MESVQRERCENGGGQLGVPVFSPNHPSSSDSLTNLCPNSPMWRIADETFPYVSGIFDETIEPTFNLDGPGTTGLPDSSQLKILAKSPAALCSGLRSQIKAAYSSWLGAPLENGHSVDFSMSITSPPNVQEEVTNVSQANLKEGTGDIGLPVPESNICFEKSDLKLESQNSTFDVAKGHKEKSSELSSSISLPCAKTKESSNVTFEKTHELKDDHAPGLSPSVSSTDASLQTAHEKNLNSTVDVCGPSNITTEQTNEKLDNTVDICQPQSYVPSTEDCEKHGTFTKTSEETCANLTGDVEQNDGASLHVSTNSSESSSANPYAVDRTFTKPNTTTDSRPLGPLPNLKNADGNSTMNMTKPADTGLPTQTDGGSEGDKHIPEPTSTMPIVKINSEVVVCSNRTLDLPDTEGKEEEHQDMLRRRNGVSEQECFLNMDISHSSVFSFDTLEMKQCGIVTSTPIVLDRGFDRLRRVKATDIQKRLSVINSIEAQSIDDLVGVSEHDTVDPSQSNLSSVKPEMSSQTHKVSVKSISDSSTSESAVVNKPLSQLAVRRKIPHPSCKSNISKTQILSKHPIPQTTSVVSKAKTVSSAPALDQPETSSTALRSIRRLNKGKTLVPPKNTLTAGTLKMTSVANASSRCTLTTDSKPSPALTQSELPSLPPPGRGRFGFKQPGAVGFSAESHSQTNNKPTGLSEQLTCAEAQTSSKPAGRAQKPVTAPKPKSNCEKCTLLQEKLNTLHKELGEILKQQKILAGCGNWLPFQEKLEKSLEELNRCREDHL